MHTINVNNFFEFEKAIEPLMIPNLRQSYGTCFRGQTDHEWTLMPSIWRLIPETMPDLLDSAFEEEAMTHFQRRAHLLLNPALLPEAQKFIEWLTIMQHYNAPTRLLDWSRSPYVALYFAVEEKFKQNGAVWYFNFSGESMQMHSNSAKNSQGFPNWPDPLDKEESLDKVQARQGRKLFVLENIVSPDHYKFSTDRLISQQGTFTVTRKSRIDHADTLNEIYTSRNQRLLSMKEEMQPEAKKLLQNSMGKIIIAASAKRSILNKLNAMNINANSLFPGLDGLGRSVANIINRYTGPNINSM